MKRQMLTVASPEHLRALLGIALPLSSLEVLVEMSEDLQIDDLTLLTVPQSTPRAPSSYQMIGIRIGDHWGYLSNYGSPVPYDSRLLQDRLGTLFPLPWPLIVTALDAVAGSLRPSMDKLGYDRIEIFGGYSQKRLARHLHLVEVLSRRPNEMEIWSPTLFSFGYFHTLLSEFSDRFSRIDWCDTSLGRSFDQTEKASRYDTCLISGSALADASFMDAISKAERISENIVIVAQSCCNLLRLFSYETRATVTLFLEGFPFWYFEGSSRIDLINRTRGSDGDVTK